GIDSHLAEEGIRFRNHPGDWRIGLLGRGAWRQRDQSHGYMEQMLECPLCHGELVKRRAEFMPAGERPRVQVRRTGTCEGTRRKTPSGRDFGCDRRTGDLTHTSGEV